MLKSKGGSKGSGGPADKKQTIMAVVAIVVILAVGAIFAKSFLGGGDSAAVDTSMPAATGTSMPGATPTGTPPTGAPTPDASAQSAPAPGAPAPAASAPAPSAQPASAPSAQPAASGAKPAAPTAPTQQIKVFGAVNVTYPSSWKIDASVANHAAVFTNGTGSFEVRTPDPTADNAKTIAEKALKAYAPGGAVAAQGADKIAGNDAYWFAVNFGSQTIRVVGVDAPTRVVLLARAPKSAYSSYRSKFDAIQKSLTF